MKLLVASRNQGKIAEIRRLLDDTGWLVVGLPSLDSGLEIVEDGETFEQNARKKAYAAAEASKMWTLADDSGLEIDALGGEPGVHSARYCGPDAAQIFRNRRIQDCLVAVPEEQRTARFRCVMCLIDPAGKEKVFEGTCEGKIAYHARGSAGFGYDPIFIPEGYSRTFAELGLETKNRFSHRARAMRQVVDYLRTRVRADTKSRKRGHS